MRLVAAIPLALAFAACSSGDEGAGGAGGGAAAPLYPDIATLHALGLARTCALNQGVCHARREYPELGALSALTSAVGAPCQLGIQDPAKTLAACEIPGDRLSLGGHDAEILRVAVAPGEPFPPRHVDVTLAAAPPSLDPTGARLHRPAAMGGDALSRSLAGVAILPGAGAAEVTLDLIGAADPGLAGFLDVRAWRGDRVRMGDPNSDGMAHGVVARWAEIMPGDPGRSLFYKRLLSDAYGPVMPLIPRAWSPAATRAVWCWIRGLPASATPATVDAHAPIDYAGCPPDPDAPDPGAAGGWPAVKLIVASRCATMPCHSAETRPAKLDLSASAFAMDVINTPSTQDPGALRVAPGQPAASYLLCKVDPECTARAPGTGLMPLGATPLSSEEITTITGWILGGAPTD